MTSLLSFLLAAIVSVYASGLSCELPTDAPTTTTTPTTTYAEEEECPLYRIRVECPGCLRTCASLMNPPHACPEFCVFGGICVCDEEFYENDDGDCVPAYECPGYEMPPPDNDPIPYPVPPPPEL